MDRLGFLETSIEREKARTASLEQIYGSAAVMGRDLDLQMLSQFGRLPGSGLQSSLLGLRSMTGDLDDCAWPKLSSTRATARVPRVAGFLAEEEAMPSPFAVLHSTVEKELGLAPKPLVMEMGDLPRIG